MQSHENEKIDCWMILVDARGKKFEKKWQRFKSGEIFLKIFVIFEIFFKNFKNFWDFFLYFWDFWDFFKHFWDFFSRIFKNLLEKRDKVFFELFAPRVDEWNFAKYFQTWKCPPLFISLFIFIDNVGLGGRSPYFEKSRIKKVFETKKENKFHRKIYLA